MRCRGKGDAIPILALQDAPRFAAGSFTSCFGSSDIYMHDDLSVSAQNLLFTRVDRTVLRYNFFVAD